MSCLAVRILPAIASAMLIAGAAHAAPSISPTTHGWEEVGEASWYGGYHQGRRTTSGAIFDQNAMTAAHASLPLGMRVRVTVQETGASVVVTITDRQPPKLVRCIDLARGAAARIGIVRSGTAMVTLTAADTNEPIEVAEAPADDQPLSAAAPRRRGQRHTHRAARGV